MAILEYVYKVLPTSPVQGKGFFNAKLIWEDGYPPTCMEVRATMLLRTHTSGSFFEFGSSKNATDESSENTTKFQRAENAEAKQTTWQLRWC